MLTGADQLVDEVVRYLCDAISVNVVGPHGSGRTRVVGDVVAGLKERGLAVVLVRGVRALRDRPLAALALAGVDIAQSGAPMVIPQAAQALAGIMPRGRSALLIDDADDLDPLSAGVVAAAHADRGFPVLFATLPAGRHQAPNQALYDGLRPSVLLRVEPLEFSQLHRLVHELLPGPVDPSAVAQIATLSGGLPGLVRAIVDTGRRTGAIALEQAIWRTKQDLWDDRLTQTVEPLLAALGDDESEVLTRLAVAGAMPVAAARALVPDASFAHLDDLRLLEVVDTPAGALVAVFPRLVAEYLRRAGSARLLSSGESGPVGVLRDADGVRRQSLSSARVAVLNSRIVDHWRVEVGVRRSDWQADPTPAKAVPLLVALNAATAGPEEFEAVLRGTSPSPTDTEAAIQLLGWQALYQGVLRREFASARQSLVERRQSSPQFAAQLLAAEATLCLAAGIVPDDSVLAAAGPGQDPQSLETLDVARRTALVYAGRTTDAVDGLPSQVLGLSDYAEPVRGVVVMARLFDGDLDVGIEWALSAMREAEDRLDAGGILQFAYLAAIGLMFAGRLDEAQAILDPALALAGPTMMHEYYHTGVLGLAALAASWRGRQDYFDALSAQAEAVGLRSGPFPDILRVTNKDPSDESAVASGQAIWAVVAERIATGHVAAAISLAVEAVELCPGVDDAGQAAHCAIGTQSPLFAAFGRYIEAVAASDPDRLAQCATDFRRLGATVYSAKAGVRLALVLRAGGDFTGSVRQAEAAWAQARERGSAPVGLFHPLGRALGFSTRELEIARLLADGMNSQTIATTLGISYRTVENYLSSAYRKLGSTGRADLIRAVTTWAAHE